MAAEAGSAEVEFLVIDFTDWFFQIPLHHQERKHFVATYNGTYIVFLTMAQGSVNAPLVCGRVAAFVARLTQSLFVRTELRLQLYVDDPLMAAAGSRSDRDLSFATVILLWAGLGIKLAYKKAERGHAITWIGASLKVDNNGTWDAQITASAKQEIVDEVRDTALSMLESNVIAFKQVQSFLGKANHIAGIVESWRPFLQDMWGAVGAYLRGERGAAPPGCIWSKQVAGALRWILSFYKHAETSIVRVFVMSVYFGEGDQVHITTDASPWGIGGCLSLNGQVVEYFADALTARDAETFGHPLGDSSGQQVWEALVMLVALRLWEATWKKSGVTLMVRSDSISTLTLRHKLRPAVSSPALGLIARELAIDLGTSAYKPRFLQHIPGLANAVADALSRLAAPGHGAPPHPALRHALRRAAPARELDFFRARAPPASH